jgi:hypothetical protein
MQRMGGQPQVCKETLKQEGDGFFLIKEYTLSGEGVLTNSLCFSVANSTAI